MSEKSKVKRQIPGEPLPVDTEATIGINKLHPDLALSAKLEQALAESDNALGEDWDKFKAEWLNKDHVTRLEQDADILERKTKKAKEQVRNGDFLTEKEMDDEIRSWG